MACSHEKYENEKGSHDSTLLFFAESPCAHTFFFHLLILKHEIKLFHTLSSCIAFSAHCLFSIFLIYLTPPPYFSLFKMSIPYTFTFLS